MSEPIGGKLEINIFSKIVDTVCDFPDPEQVVGSERQGQKEGCVLYKELTLDSTNNRRERSILVKRKTVRFRKQWVFKNKPTVFKYKRWSFKTSLASFELTHAVNEHALHG